MIQIFYHKATLSFSVKKWAFYFQQMPEDIKERIRRYRQEKNKYQLLIGRLLLKEGMHALGFHDFRLDNVHYNENNCPLWHPEINFNITHSGNIIACAFSETTTIGLDIEKIRTINIADFKYILNDLDEQNIEKAKNPYHTFFKIWTIKEAVTKAKGKGLAIDVQQIYIFEKHAELNGEKWYYQPLNLSEDFAGHVISDEALNQLELKELYF